MAEVVTPTKTYRGDMLPFLTRKQALIRERVAYVLGSLYLFASCGIFFGYPEYFAKFWAITMIPIFSLRVVYFFCFNWELYLFEMCYSYNAALVVLVLYCPENQTLFCILCSVTMIVAEAVPLYRNSMVYHALEKFGGWQIHFMGPLVIYNMLKVGGDIYPATANKLSFMEFFTTGASAFLIFYLINFIILYIILGKYTLSLKKETNFALWITSSSWLKKLTDKFSMRTKAALYVLIGVSKGVPEIALTYIIYIYPDILGAFLLYTFTVGIWNASSFYMEYMPRRYNQYLEQFRDDSVPNKKDSNKKIN